MTFTSDTSNVKKPKLPPPPTQDSSWQSEDNPVDASKWKQKEPAQATEKSWASSSKKPQSTSLEDQIGTNKLDTPDYDSIENRRQQARGKRDEYNISNLQSKLDLKNKAIERAQADVDKYGDTFAGRSAKRNLERLLKEKERFEGLQKDAMNKDNPEYKKEEKLQGKASRLQRQIDQSNRNITRLQAKLDKFAREGWEADFGPAKLTRKNLALEQKKLASLQEKLEGSQDSFGEEEMAPESVSFSEAKEKWKTLGYEFSEAQVPEGWKTYYS